LLLSSADDAAAESVVDYEDGDDVEYLPEKSILRKGWVEPGDKVTASYGLDKVTMEPLWHNGTVVEAAYYDGYGNFDRSAAPLIDIKFNGERLPYIGILPKDVMVSTTDATKNATRKEKSNSSKGKKK
jgi:hypothetical protein